MKDSYMPKSFEDFTLKVREATEAFLAEKCHDHIYTSYMEPIIEILVKSRREDIEIWNKEL